MANEIKVALTFAVVNGKHKSLIRHTKLQYDQNNVGAESSIWNIGTAAENLTLNEITTPGYICIRNIDDTNYVDIGYDDGGTFRDFIRMKPNEIALFRIMPTKTLRGQANTAAVDVQYCVYED